MKKFWALLLALCLLGGFALGECPRFALEDYPRVDGSTSMLPLSRALMMASTGAGAQEAELRVSHAKTTLSFYALVGGEADLLLVARPAQEAFDYAEDMGVELEMRPIGVDALVFLTSDQNPWTASRRRRPQASTPARSPTGRKWAARTRRSSPTSATRLPAAR